jgi:hypothetical protein
MKKCCSICGWDSEELTHLTLYVNGSEGIEVCLECRIALTEYARGMTSACFRGMKAGFRLRKKIDNL